MHVMRYVASIGVGVILTGYLSGAPVFAADKPIEDGSKIVITSPRTGDIVTENVELTYQLTKGSQAVHVHVFVDNKYQKGFSGTIEGLSKGQHKITVTGATKDHNLVAASQTITVHVQ